MNKHLLKPFPLKNIFEKTEFKYNTNLFPYERILSYTMLSTPGALF